MAEPTDLSRAQDEYGSSASPYASLSDYLMQQPVYDRGPREAPATPTMRQLEGPTTDELLADQYSKIMAEQKVADEASSAARQTEIDNLQTLLREEISTSSDAASSQRSDMTTALENRIKELQAGVDTETAALRQQGLDERSTISAEQQRISDMVQANMDQTATDLAAQEERVKTAQAAAIGSLEDKQGSLIGDINTRIGELGASLNDTTAQINTELDARDAALTGSQKSAAEAAQQQIDAVKGDLVTIQSDIQTENSAQLQALRGERETLIGNIEANVETLKDNIAGLPIDDLQLQIEKLRGESESLKSTSSEERKDLFSQMEALRDGALTNDQVNTSIAQALEAGTLSPDQVNTAIDALKVDVEGKIGGLASTESLNQLQFDIEGIGSALEGTIASSVDLGLEVETLQKALDGTATKEELAAIQESLTGATGDFDTRFSELQKQILNPDDIAKQRADAIAAAMDPLAAQRQEAIAAAMNPIAQQRQEAITGAINPIQAQIEELRGSIPAQQNIDIDALRKSIIDELKTQTPAPGGGTGGGGNVDVGPIAVEPGFSGTPIDNFMGGYIPTEYIDVGPSASEAAGFNPAGGGNQSPYGQGGSASADFYGNAPVGSMGNTGVDYTQYDPGDYARSSELGYRGAANYNQGPFQVQKFDNDLFNRTNFGM
jgi:hypothetical protein